MYCYSKKEKKRQSSKQCHFRWHCTSSTSPRRAVGRGKRFFSPLLHHLSLSLSLSLSHLPKNTDTTHTPSCPTTMMKGAEGTSLTGDSGVAT